jgi:hypothetical protein
LKEELPPGKNLHDPRAQRAIQNHLELVLGSSPQISGQLEVGRRLLCVNADTFSSHLDSIDREKNLDS